MVFEKLCTEFLLNIIATWKGKGKEYAPRKSCDLSYNSMQKLFDGINSPKLLHRDLKCRVQNLLDNSEFNRLPPERISLILATKALMSLRDMIEHGEVIPVATRIEKMGDIMIYLLLINALYTMSEMEDVADTKDYEAPDLEIAEARRYTSHLGADVAFERMLTLIYDVSRKE